MPGLDPTAPSLASFPSPMASSRLDCRTLSFFSSVLPPLLGCCVPPSSSAAMDSGKVSLALHYESLCPYSANFIVNYLVKLFEDDLISIVDLKLSPWGNAKLRSNDTFTCQNDLFLSFIAPRVWLMSTGSPNGSCVTRNWAWIQSLLLNATAVDMHGKKLELQYAAETSALQPPHQYVPSVVADGKPLYEEYENCLSYVCNACNGTTALKACSKFSLSTIRKESSKSTRSVGCDEGNMAAVFGRIGSTITSWIRQMNLEILIWTFMV